MSIGSGHLVSIRFGQLYSPAHILNESGRDEAGLNHGLSSEWEISDIGARGRLRLQFWESADDNSTGLRRFAL